MGLRSNLVLVTALASADAHGAPAAPRSSPGPVKALVGGTLVDGFRSTPIRNSVILVEGERIRAVGTVETLDVPPGSEVISTEGMTVLPGLWDNHVHLMINGHAFYRYWHETYRARFAREIMPASARQLLLSGVTSARDLGAPLEDILEVKRRIETGEIPGPRLFVSGPFIQKAPYAPWNREYRWGVNGARDARAKVKRLADAGVDFIKLIDQDKMTLAEAQAVVDEAHERGLKVIAHGHRPDEIRVGLKIGVDNFEHTGLATAPEYPPDVIQALRERTAAGMIHQGPLFWTPTVSGLFNYPYVRDNPELLDTDCFHLGLKPDIVADIQRSLRYPERLPYFQITPQRSPTLRRKIAQLRRAGVVFLVGTDSGIPLKFHCQTTWNELDVLVREMRMDPYAVIKSATYWPAVFMNRQDDLGTVSEGKLADIIAVKGDVIRYINLLQRVDFVMKGGTVYKNVRPR